jgi:predicted nucleic acid-binding protein
MTFLDSSTVTEYLRDGRSVVDYLDECEPWWTSAVCVFEVLNGSAGSADFDPVDERRSPVESEPSRPPGFGMRPSRTAANSPTATP